MLIFDLKRFRQSHSLTQKEIAFILGCGQTFVSLAEKNMRFVSTEQLDYLREKYNDVDDYFVEISEVMPIIEKKDEPNKKSDGSEPTDDITENNSNITSDEDENITYWMELVNKQQDSINKLTEFLKQEKSEKEKLIDIISRMSLAIVENKAV